jgi:hypothetical protein
VPFFLSEHAADFWKVARRNANRRLARLARDGWLEPQKLLYRPTPPITAPVFRWSPGDPLPPLTKLDYLAHTRFADIPVQMGTAYLATRKTCAYFGCSARSPLKPYQHTHDARVTQTYLYFHNRWPRLTRDCFVGEALFCRNRGHAEKVEDAQLVDRRTGRPFLVVEVLGAYPVERLKALHDEMTARNLPYMYF